MLHPLSAEERLYIIAASMGIILATAVVMACKLIPCCWLHKYCPLRAKSDEENKEKQRYENYTLVYENGGLMPIKPIVKSKLLQNGPAKMQLQKQLDDCASPYSSMENLPVLQNLSGRTLRGSVRSYFSTTSGSSMEASPIYKTHPAFPQLTDSPSFPQLQIGLRYAANEGKLMLLIQSLEHLPFNPYGTTGTCFIRILIVKDHKRRWRRKSNLAVGDLENGYEVSELTTRAVRRSAKTDFNEHFNVEITEKELRYAVIKMLVFGSDRGGHEALIGECHVSLGKQEFQSNETQEFTLKLYQSNENLGQIQLTLSYLPTAGRLNVLILKASGLKPPYGSTEPLNPSVKASMLVRSRTVEKHRTQTLFNTYNPVFNDTMTFNLPQDEIDKVTLLLTVLHRDQVVSDSSSTDPEDTSAHLRISPTRERRKSADSILDFPHDDSTLDPSSIPNVQKSKSTQHILPAKVVVLGRLAFSYQLPGSAHIHWLEMLQNPREPVTKWHKLHL